MVIVRRREYSTALKVIVSFISKDSRNRALNFTRQLDNKITDLVNFPYKFKQSKNHSDEDVRDMTFKGYTITYFIENEKNRISILELAIFISGLINNLTLTKNKQFTPMNESRNNFQHLVSQKHHLKNSLSSCKDKTFCPL